MRIPRATYRIQFNSAFGFEDAQKIASYLAHLGISDLYASPIFKARAGSTHGYDVVDPSQLNPELGSSDAFESLVQELQSHQMGWLQDIVPNHMAYDSENQYLMDVLENGPSSDYVEYFDIAWNAPFANSEDRILAPLLGDFYGRCLENGQIQLDYDETGLSVNYYSLKLPLKLESYAQFLTQNLGQLARTLGRHNPDFVKLLGILYLVKSVPSEVTGKQRQDQIAFVKGLLWELYTSNEEVKAFIEQNIQTFNGETGNPESFNLLDSLLSDQFFRLSFWKVGAEEINYRRFFTVNELISVKVEELKVFNNTHNLIFKLVESGKFTGLRIDHIDGLYNPIQYLERLREKTGDTYITVEKILEAGEDLPSNWPIEGTSGYDYLNYVNGIFCRVDNEQRFDEIYTKLTRTRAGYGELVNQNKRLILEKNLAGDIENLTYLLKNISSKYRYGNDFTINGLKRALAEVLTIFPIYRTYITQEGLPERDRGYITEVIDSAKERVPLLQNELNFIEKLLLLEYDDSLTQAERDYWLYFVMRLQQYTGPLMAKGVEDTTLYVYNRLLSLNEVGGDPSHFGLSLDAFHEFNHKRQTDWPYAMSATATHDTKRGEDVRARLNVLSEIPDEWEQQVSTWSQINRSQKVRRQREIMPDENDEYFFYQTVVGAFPFQDGEFEQFVGRVKDYVIKGVREAKVHTAWLRPDAAYEDAFAQFVESVLQPGGDNPFLKELRPFQERVAYYGMFNSLSQTLLKLTSPGIPDIYQGTEFWELSLVDPDNRRPVDFEQRQACLDDLKQKIANNIPELITELLETKEDGRIKLFLTFQGLQARAKYSDLFQDGDYLPLQVSGKLQDHIIAFARRQGNATAIAIAPRFLTNVIQPGEYPLTQQVWEDTAIELPQGAPTSWHNAITAQSLQAEGRILVGEALQHFPVALLFG
ncbi:malto-oligosyltrehalose synthase [Trichocoleus sp. FACHB-262]|uniref:malto-oligosyltrehalose synthase n=1 Tax=Trichocoleus sp. FACHB-262 TaxID=2692869 RepID=UPI0016859114|nr:malto-oligosyltrehalose synthase [Trichocoleus sp. FACHB-262]MBD2123442.1 malto-oligosyltrehalose synthase [Trichocoleus sp. FACHB-262]